MLSILLPHHIHRNTAPPPHLSDVVEIRCLHPQIRDKLHARRYLLGHEHSAMAEPVGHGDQLDRPGNFLAVRRHFLCACWCQGTDLPGQQDAWRTGRRADDHIGGLRARRLMRRKGSRHLRWRLWWDARRNHGYTCCADQSRWTTNLRAFLAHFHLRDGPRFSFERLRVHLLVSSTNS